MVGIVAAIAGTGLRLIPPRPLQIAMGILLIWFGTRTNLTLVLPAIYMTSARTIRAPTLH